LTPLKIFNELGGFDEKRFPVSLNDVDYSMRLAAKGLKTLYVPGAELIHHESRTRTTEDDPAELAEFVKIYNPLVDPYYNPNLSTSESFEIDPDSRQDYEGFLSEPLKVMFFSHNLNHEGATKIALQIASELNQNTIINTAVISFTDGPMKEPMVQKGVDCRTISLPGVSNVLAGWLNDRHLNQSISTVEEFLKDESPDVVFVNTIHNFFAVIAAANVGIPTVWCIHESYDQKQLFEIFPRFAISWIYKAFHKANRVIFVSNGTKALFDHHNHLGNFAVIHNSVMLQDEGREGEVHVVRSNSEVHDALGIGRDVKIILNVGTVCRRKDQATLVRAMGRLKERRQDCCAVLVGGRAFDRYNDDIRKLIKKFELENQVKLVDETKDVMAFYKSASIYAFTSLNESYSLTIIEAMASGLPIVTTPCFGISEQVRFGVNALPFDFGDDRQLCEKICDLLDNPEQMKSMSANSYHMWRYLPKFSKMIEQHRKMIVSSWHEGAHNF
jgi:O-antigen biosynthesis protein